MLKKIIYFTVLIASTTVAGFAQTPTPTPAPMAIPQAAPTPVNLETILTEAEKQIAFYQETFRDLLATETKTFEEYDKNGDLDERTVVESNFLVYQSAKDASRTAELRNVLKVDGKLIPDSQARADRFLSELQKSKTLEKELEKIQEEGLRYDKTLRIVGYTLFEGVVLAKNLRPAFDFKLISTENLDGKEVFVISYEQTKKSPFITIDDKESKEDGLKLDFDVNLPGALKKNDKFLRGKLWIDAQTFQLWREERQVIVRASNAPLVALETLLEYTPSEFGVLVPKKIVFTDNKLRKVDKESFNAVKGTQVTFDYSKFKKTNVDVQIIDEP